MRTTLSRVGGTGVAAVLLATGLLSGCGVTDAQPLPGVAYEVEDESVSLDQVDDDVDDLCDFIHANNQPPYPLSIARSTYVSLRLQRVAVEALLDETGAELGDDYDTALDTIADSLVDAPAGSREALRTIQEAGAYVNVGGYAVGEALFAQSGENPGTAQDVADRGQEAVGQWLADHDVQINPVLQLGVVDGVLRSDTAGLTVPVSDLAKLGQIDPSETTNQAVDALTAELPDSQLCG